MKSIELKCEKCHEPHTVQGSEVEYEQVSGDDRQMGAALYYEALVEFNCDCGNAITIKSSFTEYPIGSESDATTTASGGTITKIVD
ncbi:hypothetical protein [Aquitalea aquatica]|uniref:Uncharacterized protein n=1 Tax=Aquitalea aquatica TaxID=3044273 RepID=A0A838Y523_9NEIS|nr:hypothetical protein [Aquitalea magnusonii]MBA4710533.1 hypothetical protein [Aquitalea magnusonii]